MITCGDCGFRTHLMVIYLSFDKTFKQQVERFTHFWKTHSTPERNILFLSTINSIIIQDDNSSFVIQ